MSVLALYSNRDYRGKSAQDRYRTADYRIVGAPAWISSDRYDITAKVDDNPPPPGPVLVRALRTERFHLVARNEMREMPVFDLVVARNDRKLGPQSIPTEFDFAAYAASPHPLPDPTRTPPCGMRSRPGVLSGKAISTKQLPTTLTA